MKKRNLFLAVALIALMTGVLSAQTYDSESDFQVTKSGNAITITKYVGTKTAVNIPPTIQNTPVNRIGNGAFFSTNIASVTIPSSVLFIDVAAFNVCNSLTSVTFQGSINMGNFSENNAFPGDLRTKFYTPTNNLGNPGTYTRPNGTNNIWTRQAVTATAAQSGDPESDFKVTKSATAVTITGYVGTKTVVNIPSRIQNLPVTDIGDDAFSGCAYITSITIPNSVDYIGGGAFRSTGLTSVTIPNSVTEIGSNAFGGCRSLTSVTIGSGVKKIGSQVFNVCDKLTSVTFQGTIPSSGISASTFRSIGDLRDKFYAANGTAGTYTRPNGSSDTWTKK